MKKRKKISHTEKLRRKIQSGKLDYVDVDGEPHVFERHKVNGTVGFRLKKL